MNLADANPDSPLLPLTHCHVCPDRMATRARLMCPACEDALDRDATTQEDA